MLLEEFMPYPSVEMKMSIELMKKRLESLRFQRLSKLTVTAWRTKEPVSFANRYDGTKMDLTIGESWGEVWDCGWFFFEGQVAKEQIEEPIVALIDISGELCIYKEGRAYQGLTNVQSEFERSLGKPGKRVVELKPFIDNGGNIALWGDGACNDLFGNYEGEGRIKEAYVAMENPRISKVFYDYDFLLSLYEVLNPESARAKQIFHVLSECTLKLTLDIHNHIESVSKALDEILQKGHGDDSLTFHAIGHAHIDLAWLWPIRETKRKGLRTFATVMRMMERYPDYQFGASQAQLFSWIEESDPHLFEEVTEQITLGRFEVQGALWVESDTNIPAGESLVRQLVYGKQYFKDKFGKDMKLLWLPDAFGYSSVLPQLMKKSGVDYFMTIKLSWNQYNRFPHHTFHWVGNDGSRILAHMPPEDTYNSPLSPKSILHGGNRFIDSGISDEALVLYGIGDGGGGPGEGHLERHKRIKDVSGLYQVKASDGLSFFESINKNKELYKEYSGKLYLERHQGTFTSQSDSKYYNRWFEDNLKVLEWLLAMPCHEDKKYAVLKEVEKIWKEILLYQFHDILPGSSIARVYEESIFRYKELQQDVMTLIEDCVKDITHEGVVINPLPINRREWMKDEENNNILIELSAHEWKKMDEIVPVDKPWMSKVEIIEGGFCMENECIHIELDHDGSIQRIYDKRTGVDMMDHNQKSNVFTLYDDPGDAWDFSSQYREHHNIRLVGQVEVNQEQFESGKLCIHYMFNASEMTQTLELRPGESVLRSSIDIDWQEEYKMLRLSMEHNVKSDIAYIGNQYGYDTVSTKDNNSMDMARHEVCAHNYVDVTQGYKGVSLMSPTKYGYHIRENILDMNLLRSSMYPGKEIDKGRHTIEWAYYIHNDTFESSQVLVTALKISQPLLKFEATKGENLLVKEDAPMFMAKIQAEHTLIDVIKPSFDNQGVVIRYYETVGMKETVEIILPNSVTQVWKTNLLEEKLEVIPVNNHRVTMTMEPFKVETLYYTFG